MPVLNEGDALARRLQALAPLRARGAELVVVDGGSTDATWAIACAHADQVRLAPRGRARQMNAGAQGCTADALLFLHADTRLPDAADRLIARALDAAAPHPHDWGRFDVRIDSALPMLRVVEGMMNLRSRLSGIATGDQAMFVRREVFEALGGFAPIALMEDLELSARLRRRSAPACLRERVVTSGRRWEKHGAWRTILLMWRLRAAYFFGASPDALARQYGYVPTPAPAPAGRPTAAVAILAKAPVAGLAKTRLIPLLGAAGAARAQRRFARRTLVTALATAPGAVALWCAPDPAHRFFRAVQCSTGVACWPQPDGDLGLRMGRVFDHHFAQQPHTPLLLVGTDCPVLTPAHLQQAAQALATHDVVLIPAEDGGYVLIGMRRSVPPAFEGVAWSTPQVLAQTRAQLRLAGASWLELAPLWDVDEPPDWQRLQALLHPPD